MLCLFPRTISAPVPRETFFDAPEQAGPDAVGAYPQRVERDAESFGELRPVVYLRALLFMVVLQDQLAAVRRQALDAAAEALVVRLRLLGRLARRRDGRDGRGGRRGLSAVLKEDLVGDAVKIESAVARVGALDVRQPVGHA